MNLDKNKDVKSYKPISCSVYDELVLAISRKQTLEINTVHSVIVNTPVDIYTKDKEEFLLFAGGKILRLDEIKGLKRID